MDTSSLKNRLALLEAHQVEAKLRRDQTETAMAGDRELLGLLEAQLALMSAQATELEKSVQDASSKYTDVLKVGCSHESDCLVTQSVQRYRGHTQRRLLP